MVMFELCGNGVRTCGDFVPLVAEVEVTSSGCGDDAGRGVLVRLRDPYRRTLPVRGGVRLDDP
ncbi:hypothetical protein [Streptomyces cucumeris]|uniref:hypothetical protein n=1 Tax=Streptomyces cucumeris TaxID=2962890 RepID=UPI003EBDB058